MYDSTQQPSLGHNNWKKERRRKEQIAYIVFAMMVLCLIFCMMNGRSNSLPDFRIPMTGLSGLEKETALSMAEGKQVYGGLIFNGEKVSLETISTDIKDDIEAETAPGDIRAEKIEEAIPGDRRTGKIENTTPGDLRTEKIEESVPETSGTKTMYLTFDDGPYKKNTERVLDILKERNVKATFFLVGEYVEKNPEIAQRIAREGHAIGVHCYRHDYDLLYASMESYVEDFEKAHTIIKEVTGIDTKMFRFPGGSINDFNEDVRAKIIQEMTKRGYIYYDWNASLEDAVADPQEEKLIANALASTFDRKKVIMLAHDVVYETGMCLDELLDQFPEYKMEVLTPEVKPIQF